MLKVIHITPDDKFFDGPIKCFESDPSIENVAYLSSFGNKKLKYIKSSEKIHILRHRSDLRQILETGNYDVVFFYSLPFERWWMVDTIPANKKIIWWEWGFDLYGRRGGLDPLINIPLYKPLTQKYVNRRFRTFAIEVKNLLLYNCKRRKLVEQRSRVLARIDYLMPVLSMDYDYLKKHQEFKAKEFYYYLDEKNYQFKLDIRNEKGGILLGNSSMVTNNHLDIWKSLKETDISGREIIVPLNYGEFDTASYISKKITSKTNKVMALRKFMPQKEYFELIDKCSYAIFGAMRQQAVGNIMRCIRDGIKVFLYRDSVCYNSLKKSGYKVFAIEEMSIESLSTPMTYEDNFNNQQVFLAELKRKNTIYNRAIQDIKNDITSYHTC